MIFVVSSTLLFFKTLLTFICNIIDTDCCVNTVLNAMQLIQMATDYLVMLYFTGS